jgi:hypothetical protein
LPAAATNDHAALEGPAERLFEHLFEHLFALDGTLRKGETQVDHSRARFNAFKIAAASSSGVALGMCSRPELVSAKIGRIRRLQLGQMAGAGDPRLADRIPAINVPCRQGLRACGAAISRNFAELLVRQIGMLASSLSDLTHYLNIG